MPCAPLPKMTGNLNSQSLPSQITSESHSSLSLSFFLSLSSSSMADWTHLPSDLLTLIATHLTSHFDQLRLRSVCTTWRLSLSPPISPRISILPNDGISETSWGFSLSKRTILSLSSPRFPTQSWLIKIEQDNPAITHLLNPLTSSQFDLNLGLPKIIDSTQIRVSHSGTESENPTETHLINSLTSSESDLNLGLPETLDSTQIKVSRSGIESENPTETHLVNSLTSSQSDLNLDLPETLDSTQIRASQSGTQLENPTETHIVIPLDNSRFYPDSGFPKTLDLLPIRVSELGSEYILRYINYRPFANSISDAGNLYMEKVALFFDSRNGYVLLTIHVSGKLAIFRIGDKKWTVIDDFLSPYDDVLLFNKKFYAVDSTGRAVTVNLNPSNSLFPVVEMMADPVFGGDKKTMVASGGELLLIDTYLSVGPEDDMGFEEEVEFYEEFDCYMSERTVRFKVFKLNSDGKKWDEVKDLGNRILFLGDYCSFSASASDFDGCKGNCIIFADRAFYSIREEEEGPVKSRGVGVFDLESGSIGFLGNYPGFSKMFWPPPSWVSSSSSTSLEDGLNQLGI